MRIYETLQLRALRRLSAVSAVSSSIRDRIRRGGLREERIHLVRNAWQSYGESVNREQARAELGLPSSGLVVGWVGRLSHEKGADVLIDALSIMSKRNVRICFVGDGPEAEPLRERASRAGVADQIHWAGMRPSAARLFQAFDVFVLSSRTEGTPIVLFEAAAARVPIVATAAGGVPDVVSKREAVLVAHSRPGLLARAIEESLEDTPERRARLENAQARIETQFALAPWLDCYEEIYSSLLSRD
jgi:glycosyltransferase involved in cell wall biosynthesis